MSCNNSLQCNNVSGDHNDGGDSSEDNSGDGNAKSNIIVSDLRMLMLVEFVPLSMECLKAPSSKIRHFF